MAEVFTTSGEDSNNVTVPRPILQGLLIPGIDDPQAVDGFGIVTPWGGGSTTRRYGDYGISQDISSQQTQLNDLSSAFIPAEGRGIGTTYNFEGLVGPQGPRGPAGPPGVSGITSLPYGYVLPTNSNFLAVLPHNIDQINVLGTAADKLLYTDALNTYGGSTEWVERQPAGAVNVNWQSVASDLDGSNLIACVEDGRLYTSADYGVTWTERQPAGAANKVWAAVASDADGSHLIAVIKDGRLYTSNNSGVSWTERQPAGNADKQWSSVASDSDGSNLIACVTNGRLYTSANYGVSWTERQPDDADDNYWTSVASDDDGSVLIAGKGNTTVAALYISINSGVSWSEEIPAAATISWYGAASDADGSVLIAGGLTGRIAISADSGGSWTLKGAAGGDDWHCTATNSDGSYIIVGSGTNLYESFDSGVTFAETKPAGATTKVWRTVSTSLEGSNTIVGVRGGRLYTGTVSMGYSEATWAEADLTSAGRAILDDANAAAQATTLGVGTGDSPTWAGATFTGTASGVIPTAGAHLATKEYVDLAIGASSDYFLSDNDDAIANYHILYETDTGEAASDEETAAMDEGDDQLMFSFITASGVPGVTFLRSGIYVLHTHLARTTGNRPTTFYWTLSKYALNADETVLMTSETSSAIPGSMASFITHAVLAADATILTTDRLVLKLHANVTGGGQDSIITIYMEGSHDCHLTNLLPSDIWQTQGDMLDAVNALGDIADNEFLVGTGAGTLAWESGATARTSLGVESSDDSKRYALMLC